jgi:hypothetical protein
MSLQKIAHQKVEKLSFFSKIWWDDAFLRLDEMTLSNLMNRFRQIWWDDVFIHQVWWIAFVKFDESLIMSLMRCLVNFNDVSSQTSLDKSRINMRHSIIENKYASFVKNDDEMIKHDHENELLQTISAKDKFKSHFSDHISHFETRRKNTLSAYSRSNLSQYSSQ